MTLHSIRVLRKNTLALKHQKKRYTGMQILYTKIEFTSMKPSLIDL